MPVEKVASFDFSILSLFASRMVITFRGRGNFAQMD